MVHQGERLPLAYMEPNRLSIIPAFVGEETPADKPSLFRIRHLMIFKVLPVSNRFWSSFKIT